MHIKFCYYYFLENKFESLLGISIKHTAINNDQQPFKILVKHECANYYLSLI